MTLENRMMLLYSYIAHIENINRGGCLFAALAVYRVLKKEGYDCKDLVLVQLHNDYNRINDNIRFISGESEKANSSNHFVLSFNGGKTLVGTNGYHYPDIYDECCSYIIPNDKIEMFCENALMNGNWNHRFVRSKGVREINFTLGIKIPHFRKNYKIKFAK